MTTTIPAWREQIGPLRYLAVKVARVHGPAHPDMATLSEVVATLADSTAGDLAGQTALARRLRELTHDFRPWDGACGSVRQLFHGLAAVVVALPTCPGAAS